VVGRVGVWRVRRACDRVAYRRAARRVVVNRNDEHGAAAVEDGERAEVDGQGVVGERHRPGRGRGAHESGVRGDRVGEDDVGRVVGAGVKDSEAVSYLTAEGDRLVAGLGYD